MDIGDLANTWRIQPGTAAYCTELPAVELRIAVGRANTQAAPARRDLIMTFGDDVTVEGIVRLNRAVTGVPVPA